MDFDLSPLSEMISNVKPCAVFIGYNSKPKAVPLPEPSKEKTLQLVSGLENQGIQVFRRWGKQKLR